MGDFLYLCFMEKGYVYIARIIDHGGKFVNGYHKIGKSKQYRIRETQLNSTNLPFDILMIRVFDVYDMSVLETILHTCFADYRVVKEYEDRKNITTEWFDVSDIDTFNDRLNKVVNAMNITEVELEKTIENDKTLTEIEKNQIKDKIVEGSKTSLRIVYGDRIFTDTISKNTYCTFVDQITKEVNPEEILEMFPAYFRKNKEDFTESLQDSNKVLLSNGLYFSTWGSNKFKMSRLNTICNALKINDVKIDLI